MKATSAHLWDRNDSASICRAAAQKGDWERELGVRDRQDREITWTRRHGVDHVAGYLRDQRCCRNVLPVGACGLKWTKGKKRR